MKLQVLVVCLLTPSYALFNWPSKDTEQNTPQAESLKDVDANIDEGHNDYENFLDIVTGFVKKAKEEKKRHLQSLASEQSKNQALNSDVEVLKSKLEVSDSELKASTSNSALLKLDLEPERHKAATYQNETIALAEDKRIYENNLRIYEADNKEMLTDLQWMSKTEQEKTKRLEKYKSS
ncbi:hypothetical protein OPT61_g7101 [Boeremia exigua]|uniref:Uncharacterized protein n=1 Tax=Boeremia exigua TaxID=749465 RepID=A0ACC2I3J4_9PLEO|nr:hypothetical protein OPT61_g7101 [Boeremia exigua]